MATLFARSHHAQCALVLSLFAQLDLQEMMAERGIEVAHTTIFRWVQDYAPELDKRIPDSTSVCVICFR